MKSKMISLKRCIGRSKALANAVYECGCERRIRWHYAASDKPSQAYCEHGHRLLSAKESGFKIIQPKEVNGDVLMAELDRLFFLAVNFGQAAKVKKAEKFILQAIKALS